MVDLDQVKELREQTQAGIQDCRKALQKAEGDMDKAKEWLAEKGEKIAAKKADRETKEGLVEAYIHKNGRVGVLLQLGCETDFVARNDEFKQLAHELAMQIAAMDPEDIDDLLAQRYIRNPKQKVSEIIKSVIAKIGENIQIEKFERYEI
jgi:elongation factor Ts